RDDAVSLPGWEPVYPLTAGVSQKLIARAAASALKDLPDLAEWIDPGLKAREAWPGWAEALRQAHRAGGAEDLAITAPARARLAYDELFAHQLTLALARQGMRRGKGRPSAGDGALRQRVLGALPWPLTGAQDRAIGEIAADMASAQRMNRLL